MNILITGVSKGLGLTICRVMLEKKWKVYGISRTRSTELDNLIKQNPKNITWCNYDLENPDKIKQQIGDRFLKNVTLDGFVNNAAYAYDDLVTNLNLDSLNKMFKVNVLSPMMITKLVIRNFLLNKKKGSIVHLSSISVHTGYKGLAMYASTKGALEAFSKNCAREWGSLGIRSNTIVAGFMETEMSAKLSKEQKNRIYKRTSTKQPVDVSSLSNTICYLLSEKANSITGSKIFVDNGTI